MKKRRRTTTLSALWRYLKRDYLTPKEENKISELANNLKIIFYLIVMLTLFLWLSNLSGCFEGKVTHDE